MITIDELTSSPKIKHGFFTREGGVSNGLYNSLNCGFGSNDETAKVAENRRRVLAGLAMPEGELLTCYQIHSATALTVTEPWTPETAPEADGMATNVPGLALGILTADCAPVLFADDKAGVIGAAHAGWQGAFKGVMEATLAEMVKLGASCEDVKVAVGPCISAESYEVGPEFWERFMAASTVNAIFFTPSVKEGHYMFNLAGYIAKRLKDAGILEIHIDDHDTCRDEALFYSYRRCVLRGEDDYGREISAISLISS
jgi:polyphenol oxidase